MSHKSNSCYLDIRTDKKNPYGLMRRSYRENGKVKKETICCLSGLSLEKLKFIKAALQNNVILKDDLKILQSREYGASYACVEFIKMIGLHKTIFSRPSEEWVRSCLAMIAGRIVYAGSKLSLSNCGSFSALWDICGVMVDIDVNTHCYNVMDRLLVRQEAIQKALADKHLSDGTLVLYDITSSYMEGEYENSKLTDFGYSRDKKRGHKQIIISLLCTKEGCPVAVDVMRGNMKDEKTVLDKIDEIHNKYGLENVVFVGDRGMVTQANYNRINHKTTKVVSAINHNSIKDLCGKGIIQIGMFDEENIIEVIDGNVRYCLCKNPVMAEKESTTRQKLLNATTDSLDKIIMCTRKTKYSKEMRAGKAVNKYKMGKFIVFEGSGNNLSYTVNQEKVEQEASLDGCYVVYTDVPPDIMSAVQTVENYKSLIQVEQAFKNMKTVQLEMRPVFHKTDDRIKCHVFICMLAYYTMWHMKQNLQALFDSDGEAIHRKFTFEYVIENLKSIRKDTVSISSVVSSVISTPSIEQKRILDLLNVKM